MSFKNHKSPSVDDRMFNTVYMMMRKRYPDATLEELEHHITEEIIRRKDEREERAELRKMRQRVNARTRDRQGVFDDNKPVLSESNKEWLRDAVAEAEKDMFAEYKAKYPGALRTAQAMLPDADHPTQLLKAREVVQWHKTNGTEETLADTYRGDFYQPVKGSPEASVYWGDFAPDIVKHDVGEPPLVSQLQHEIAEEVSRFDHNNKNRSLYDWRYVEHFAMKQAGPLVQIYTDDDTFDLNQFDYVTSVDKDWDGFIEMLQRHEGSDVWLCFDRSTKTLIDIHIHNDWDRIQDQWKKTDYERTKTDGAFAGVIEGRKKELDKVMKTIRDYEKRQKEIEGTLRDNRQIAETLQTQIHADEDAQKNAVSYAFNAHQDSLDKLNTLIKKFMDKQVKDNRGSKKATKFSVIKHAYSDASLRKRKAAVKMEVPVKVNRQSDDNEKEVLKAQLRASEAERRELINKDRIQTMVRGIKDWAATTQEEKDLMFQAMLNEDIKEFTAAEKKQFYSDAEKLRNKLEGEEEPFFVTLPTPHQREMLALRGGIEHKGSKLLIQLEEWGEGNTALVTLPDYNVRLFACLAKDRKNKSAIAAITFKHPDGQKWKSIEEEVTGVTAKFQPGIAIEKYLGWNKDVNDRLWIANQGKTA